jgi:alkanesulfonate monooxygenase SsuD/methylene tetrahydromethanopterin reductase-like flavin-dependent oxidoreductase (luciferase family)
MPDQHVTPLSAQRLGRPLHVFLRRHAARSRVAALSAAGLPECFARVRAADLKGAQRDSTNIRAAAGEQGCTVFVDIEVLVDRDARTAISAAEHLVQTSSPSALRYVGTPQGLAGYIVDLHTLGIADGVTLSPLRASDNADRIINDVLPMLGLDVARLSA